MLHQLQHDVSAFIALMLFNQDRPGQALLLPGRFISLLLLFLDEDLAADFFDAAIVFTTFHAVRDLPVAPSWQNSPDGAGNLECSRKSEAGESYADDQQHPLT